ncbi:MAG: DUF3267 domain-containing protein [Erysipelotrichaceae bacterium]|nr:DUF3267 domain-containing protein [Erysipelotrichaceae bacterium]
MTAQEQKRYDAYEQQVKELEAQGYQHQNLTLEIKSFNIWIIIVGGMISIALTFIFMMNVTLEQIKDAYSLRGLIIVLIGYVVLIVVHELIHGFFFGLFAKRGFKAIQFGVNIKKGIAYCYCGDSLTKGQYIIGCMMPGLLLGLIPLVIAFITHSWLIYILSLCMTLGASGDAAILYKLLTTKIDAQDIVYMDHPTEPGLTVFYK